MRAVLAAATAPDDDDNAGDGIIEHCQCACGRLGAITFEVDGDGDCWCVIRCACGSFTPVAPGGEPR